MNRLTLMIFSLFCITGCASIQRAKIATTAQTTMVGMSKQHVLECMGAATNVQAVGNIESWQYSSGGHESFINSNINAYNSFAFINSSVTTRYCVINITFINNIVSSISYSGKTGGLITKVEQCAYALNNCVKS